MLLEYVEALNRVEGTVTVEVSDNTGTLIEETVSRDPAEMAKYMEMFFSNGIVTSSVIFMLAVGATLPIFLLPHKAFSLTRHNVIRKRRRS